MEDHRGSEPDQPRITPGNFFSSEEEKTKLNWFLFEYACEFEMFIRKDRPLSSRLRRKGIERDKLASFCVQYAKGMKPQILDRTSGRSTHVRMDYTQVEKHLPDIGDTLVDRLLTKAVEAWDSQLEACEACPTRCISEKDQKAPMFDDPYYWE